MLDGDSSFLGELPEFALCSGQFVRLQPPRIQKGYSYGCRGGFATARDNAKEHDNDEGQCILQWTMRRPADVHEDIPRTIAIFGWFLQLTRDIVIRSLLTGRLGALDRREHHRTKTIRNLYPARDSQKSAQLSKCRLC